MMSMTSRKARPLRVLQIIAGLNIGGAEKVVDLLVRTFNRDEVRAGVCCTKTIGVLGEALQLDVPDVDMFLASSTGVVGRYLTPLKVRQCIAAFRPDVVHTHGSAAMIHTGALALARVLPPWVHTYHFGDYTNRPETRMLKAETFFSRYPSRLVAVSESQRQSIVARLGVADGRIQTIINGVPPNRFLADPSVALRKRAELGIAAGDLVIGTIAVLSEQKGVGVLLRAVRGLVDGGCPARFLIVGGGKLEESLRQEATAMGLGDHVIFAGWRQDNLELMTVLDVFVMSSLWEAMPIALLEAMAAGRAIVATDVGENARILGRGRCGTIVAPNDVQALAGGIRELAMSRARRDGLSAMAQQRHRESYSVGSMVGAYVDLFKAVAC